MLRFKRSPIFYMGNKYKLLKQLIPLFPKSCNTFVDLFGGSGVVSMNYKGKEKTIYNEFNVHVVSLIKMIVNNEPKELDSYWKSKIQEFGLETISINYEDRKNRIGYERRKESYKNLRDFYNNSNKKEDRDLFLLICYSINNLMRFNKDNKFNVSSGSGCYNDKNYKQIVDMNECLKDVEIINGSAFDFNIDNLNKDSFIYCDPPYLNTEAIYNEKNINGGWCINDDYRLFNFLELVNNRGFKFGLSNVFENRKNVNKHLIDWCKKNKWNVYHLNRNYNPFSKETSNSDEVYICNYNIDNIPKQLNMFD